MSRLALTVPAAGAPIADASGLPQRAWLDFFRGLLARTGGGNGPTLSVSVLTLAAAPTAAQITPGNAALVKNTTTGFVALWFNDAGTMKAATLT